MWAEEGGNLHGGSVEKRHHGWEGQEQRQGGETGRGQAGQGD